MLVEFTPNADCTGAATLNISALGAKPIISQAGLAMTAGDLASGRTYLCAYDGTSFRLISVTTAYVDAVRDYATSLAFRSALPAISPSVADYITTNDGSAGSWTALLKATVIRFKDGADASKLLAFDLSGITTATTRTLTAPNASGTIALLADLVLPMLHVREEQASGTNSSGAFAAASYNDRVLNTTVINTISGASLASNQITLPAGTYDYSARAPAQSTTGTKLFLYNVTDSANIDIGSSISAPGGGFATVVEGRFTIAASKVVKLRHYITNGGSSAAISGASSVPSVNEVYASLILRKVA
jgi:hypothetical protein